MSNASSTSAGEGVDTFHLSQQFRYQPLSELDRFVSPPVADRRRES